MNAPPPLLKRRAVVPVVVFVLLVGALALSLSRSDLPPRLDSISPEIGTPGGVLVLKGRHFGPERLGSSVTISGTRPTSSSYLEWTDTQISLQIPADAGTGTVYVTTPLGVSGGLLFTNKNRIPMVMSESMQPGVPFVEEMDSTAGAIGELIVITGLNFGLTRGGGRVLFTPLTVTQDTGADLTGELKAISASELDFDYESWTDQEIRVRVPDGATSGNVHVETDRGVSNAIYFEVTNLPGTKILREKRGYQILFSIQLSSIDADPGGAIDLWVPGPLKSLEQRNIEYVKIPDPLWDDYHGLSRHQIVNPVADTVYRINQTFWLDRYTLETKISVGSIGRTYDTESRLYQVYTANTGLIPAADESVINAALSAIGRERNPYLQTKAIYRFLIEQLVYDSKLAEKTILESFVAASGDAYTFSMLFCAMTRAIGIPSRPVAGFLIYGDRRARVHYWAEFYVPSFGWVPADPALGDGATFGAYPQHENPSEYFFGNVDSNHVVFTRGVVDVRPLSSDSRTVRRDGLYSLQTIHEETSKGIRSYTATWSDLQVIDLW
jgi:hypothetical protein